MRIVVDGMGGDDAPARIVDGIVLAAREFRERGEAHQVIITGQKDKITAEITRCQGQDLCPRFVDIVHTDEWIDMHEPPAEALRKKTKSSLHVGVEMVKKGEAEAVIGMGNTGAVMAVGLFGLGRIEGVQRPTIGAFFPSLTGKTLVLDVGANVDCKPQHLLQFGLMGSIYMNAMWGVNNPTVGLLSVGEEDSKGCEAIVKANELFRERKVFNFVGNVEGRDILAGGTDVVVCDGFVGNVVLKFGESVAGFLKTRFQRSADQSLANKLMMMTAKPVLMSVFHDMDYQEYGGVPLLGVNGVVIIGHGSSSARAMYSAIQVARKMVDKKINEVIKEKIKLS